MDRSFTAEELLTELTLDEKIGCLSTAWEGVPRLGIAPFNFGGECLHGLCHTGRATVFPLPIAMAATFDPEVVEKIGEAIAREARAKFFSETWPDSLFISLAYWTPNINIFRDPRWGRGQETYGEDPYLAGEMGAAFVRGLQGNDPSRYQVTACAKHYAVHSGPEEIRTSFDAQVSPKLLRETFLPHFKRLVDEGVATVMGAYNSANGKPCCANRILLEDILRGEWGFEGFVVSDAGAIAAFHRPKQKDLLQPDYEAADQEQWGFLARQMAAMAGHGLTRDEVESAAAAIRAGCDMGIGNDLSLDKVQAALQRGLVTEEEISHAAGRILRVAEKLGLLQAQRRAGADEPGVEIIQCAQHLELSRQAAEKSIVLLKNDGVLPLGESVRTIAVSGPAAADINVLLGNFYRGISGRLITIVEGIVEAAPDGVLINFMQGCELYQPNLHDSDWSIGLAEKSDVAIVALGNSPVMEGEHGECFGTTLGGDRDRLTLPEVQLSYLRRLRERVSIPVIAVVTTGSPIIMPEVFELADAVLLAWYPGEQGGRAVGNVLFGKSHPGGRLPVTFPAREEDVPDFADYSMRGRTYRYAEAEPQFPFGYGLDYTNYEFGSPVLSTEQIKAGEAVSVSATIRNTGERAGEAVAQLYLRACADAGGPVCNLRGICRVKIEAGQSETVSFKIEPEYLRFFSEDGSEMGPLGDYQLWIAPHAPAAGRYRLGAYTTLKIT